MTFKKNLVVMVIVTIVLCIIAIVREMPQDQFVAGMTMWFAGAVIALSLEDLFRKIWTDKEKLNWQYCVGTGIVLLSVLAFLWASESAELMVNIYRLMIAVFFGFLGGVWFYGPYKKSISSKEDRYTEKWEKALSRIEKAKKIEKKSAILSTVCRYRTTGDSLDSPVDFGKPIAEFNGQCLTVAEVSMFKDDPEATCVKETAVRYVDSLLKEVQ